MRYPILTDRLSIQPLSIADLDSFVEYRQTPEIARFQSWDTDYSTQQGAELIESQAGIEFPAKGEWLQIGIRLRSTGELVGDVAVHNMDADGPSVELGFTIAKDHQQQGYAREAVGAVIQAIKSDQPSMKLFAFTDARNTGSIRLLASLGFNERPDLKWTEEFKAETVEVLHFENL